MKNFEIVALAARYQETGAGAAHMLVIAKTS